MMISKPPSSTQIRRSKKTRNHGLAGVKGYLRLALISGPKLLFTSQISVKCAFIMTLMCLPSLLFCSILTIPELIFQSPHQHAYFYFGKVLNEDPTRWIVLCLTGICAFMSLAVPATMSDDSNITTPRG